jgi:hypothetical protein
MIELANVYTTDCTNIAGLAAIRVIPVDNVVSIPNAQFGIVEEAIVLADENNYMDITFEQDTADFSEDGQDSKQGEFFKTKLELFVAGMKPESDYNLGLLYRGEFVVICTDNNGRVRICGSQDYPMSFTHKKGTSKKVGGSAGYNLTFMSEAPHQSYFYNGSVPTPQRKVFSAGFSFGFLRYS